MHHSHSFQVLFPLVPAICYQRISALHYKYALLLVARDNAALKPPFNDNAPLLPIADSVAPSWKGTEERE